MKATAMLRMLPLALLAVLAACATTPRDVPQRARVATEDLPPMRVFAAQRAPAPQQSNATLARDFLELTFFMESGRPLPVFTRFEHPVTVKTTGIQGPASMDRDLDALLVRLRNEAGIHITRVASDQPADIVIETIPRRALKRIVPSAACFVVPEAASWKDFVRKRRTNEFDWAQLKVRTSAAIFLPGDVSPQEVRDCLHEELAQGLGPVNDLYRLPQTIFDDDNMYSVLTGFDMMMLRITYDPALHSGMTRAQVAARLPGILARINPSGGNEGIAPPMETPRAWTDAIITAIGPGTSHHRRVVSAERALSIAQAGHWTDPRMGFSLLVLGRVVLPDDPNLALASFFRAAVVYGASPLTQLQAANVGEELATFALASGDPQSAVTIIDHHLAVARKSQNAELLSMMLLIKAEALKELGKTREANAVRVEGLGWARYGFTSPLAVENRVAQIAALRPPVGKGAPS